MRIDRVLPAAGIVTESVARPWVDRWERMSERYAVGREERFEVVADLVAAVTGQVSRPVVVDLGCGPGSLAARLASRLPCADVVAVDADPLLVGLGRACHGDRVRFVQALAPRAGWLDRLAVAGPVDAVVTSAALHYLDEPTLSAVMRDCASLVRPGGVLVNADHLAVDPGPGRALLRALGARAGRDGEDWAAWWAAAAKDASLAGLFDARRSSELPAHDEGEVPLHRHLELLRAAGFVDVRTAWQVGTSRVLLAVR